MSDDLDVELPAAPRAPVAYHGLVGKTEDEARLYVLRMFAQAAVDAAYGRFSSTAKTLKRTPVYLVVDDGFDDACGWRPALYVFRKRHVKPSAPTAPTGRPLWGDTFWEFRGKALAWTRLDSRDWATLVSMQDGTLGGAGVCAIVGRAYLTVTDTAHVRTGAPTFHQHHAELTELEWLSGEAWEAERLETEVLPEGAEAWREE